VIDVEAARDGVEAACGRLLPGVERHYVSPFTGGELPAGVQVMLDGVVRRHRISGLIVSTEPLSHGAYIKYALSRGLSVLADKPLTTRKGVAHDPAQARGVWEDYREILAAYEAARVGRRVCLLVNSHRRWHWGFRKAFELVREIRDRFNCPVTAIHSEHCDGQWRLPGEIVTQDYHPYNRGYGKVSHSGYHILDMVVRFLKAGCIPEKAPDEFRTSSSFLLPEGFLDQLRRDDYRRYFPGEYDAVCPHTDDELRAQVLGFGEIDAHALVEFRRRGVNVAHARISLQHNGFARRCRVRPGADLYKGNGRVRHERHRIDSGPFQTVYIESYQKSDRHDRSDERDFDRGGNNHFDIVVYRDTGMTGDLEPQVTYRLPDLVAGEGFDATRLHNEQAKEGALVEFLRFIRGEIGHDDLTSGIEDHAMTARLMSAVYESHARDERVSAPMA
jgi:predicted dehydrogenase